MGKIIKDIPNLKPCPICGQKDLLYMWVDEFGKYPHITCTRCEIDTWTRVYITSIEEYWNSLPRNIPIAKGNKLDFSSGRE